MFRKKIISVYGTYQNVIVLITGSALAQLLMILATPILSRLYSAEDFGVLSLYSSLLSIIGVASTARYEVTVMLPNDDDDAVSLGILSIFMSAVVSIFLFFFILGFREQISTWLNNKQIVNYLLFLPLSVFLFALNQVLNYWFNRKEKYRILSFKGLIQSTGSVINQLAFGFLKKTGMGLVFGQIFGSFASLIVCFRYFSKIKMQLFTSDRIESIKKNAKKYSDYPKFGLISTILDDFTVQLLILFMSKHHNMETLGHIGVASKILVAPSGLISSSVGQVYFQKIARLAQENKDELTSEVKKVFIKLLLISIVLFLPFIFFGEAIFSVFLGEKWRLAGVYAQILAFSTVARFVVSPLTTVFGVTNHVKIGSIWKVIYFITSFATLTIGLRYDFKTFLIFYVVNEVFIYLLGFILILYACRNARERV